MPKIKYYQPISDIRRNLEDILINMEKLSKNKSSIFSQSKLHLWSVSLEDKSDIEKELQVVQYLMSYDLGVSILEDKNISKPELVDVKRCFNRQLAFIKDIHDVDGKNINEKSTYTHVRKLYLACKYYLFQFSFNAWYTSLPDEILTVDNEFS